MSGVIGGHVTRFCLCDMTEAHGHQNGKMQKLGMRDSCIWLQEEYCVLGVMGNHVTLSEHLAGKIL